MAPVEAGVLVQYGTGTKGKGVQEKRRVLKQPRGISLCADGDLLVADYANHCVLRFKPGDLKGTVVAGEEGKILETVDPLKDIDRPLGAPEGEGFLLKTPGDACQDPSGAILVLDTEVSRVQSFSGNGGLAPTVLPPGGVPMLKSESAPEAIKHPRAVSVCSDGSLLVCDTWSHRVLRFPAPGSNEELEKPEVLAGTPNSCGKTPEKLAFPSGIAQCPDGSLLVTDTNNHRVQRFVPGQAAATTVAGSQAGKSGGGLGELNMPTGICIDPRDGSFLVADRANARLMRFSSTSRAGDHGEVVAGPDLLERPWGVCVDGDGAIYVSDERRAVVLKLGAGAGAPSPASTSPPAVPAPAPKAALAFTPPPRGAPAAQVAPAAVAACGENPMELD